MKNTTNVDLRDRIERLVLIAGGGNFSKADLDAANGSLRDVGMHSLGYMNLILALEENLGVIIDPEEDPSFLFLVESITRFVEAQLSATP